MIGDLIAGVVGKVIDRAWPDPTQKAQMALELEKMKQAGEFKALDDELRQMQMQVDVNKVEAESPDLFKSGWRPMVGWTCASGLAWEWIGVKVVGTVMVLAGHGALVAQLPRMDVKELLSLLVPLLGLGVYRTVEKIKGVAK